MDLELRGRVAVVTGGASGIGLASAQAFAREGASVALWDIRPNVREAARRLADETGARALGIEVNVTSEDSVLRATQATIELFDHIHHLVHAAAVGSGKHGFPFTNLRADDWARVLEVNVMGTARVAHGVIPSLAGDGTVVFVASVAGQIGSQTDPPYSASKAAEAQLAKLKVDQSRKELGKREEDINKLNELSVEYEVFQRRAERAKFMYEQVLGRMKEFDLNSKDTMQNMIVIDRATTPLQPVKPNRVLVLIAGFLSDVAYALLDPRVRV